MISYIETNQNQNQNNIDTIYNNLCHYVLFCNRNLTKNWLNKLIQLNENTNRTIFSYCYNNFDINFYKNNNYDDLLLLVANGFPIHFWHLCEINSHCKLDFLKELVVDETNFDLITNGNTLVFKTNNYGNITVTTSCGNFDPDCFFLTKMNFTKKFIKIFG